MNRDSTKLEKGAFVLSIDTELAWGMIHRRGVDANRLYYESAREAVAGMLALCEKYEIRATWATVGHLMMDSCDKSDGTVHPEIVRPDYQWFKGDWFDQDPVSDIESDPIWYGSDIVESIQACSVPQEIGSHSFSHVSFDDPGCSVETADSELRECVRIAESKGISLKSFVFPRNGVGHLDVLKKHGFSSFRGVAPCWYKHFRGTAWSLAHRIDNYLPFAAPVVQPENVGGLWNIPASYYYPHSDDGRIGWGSRLPIWVRVLKARRAIKKASKQREIFHMWFHPYNIAGDMKRLLPGLERIFRYAAEMRSRGMIDNLTMGELTAQLDSKEQARGLVSALSPQAT